MNEYQYDYEWDKEYCYPNTNILRNRLNITNAEDLSAAERSITSLKIASAKHMPIKGQFDLQHLQKIHAYIFENIFDWAGRLRHVNISKGNQFCLAQYLNMYADNLF